MFHCLVIKVVSPSSLCDSLFTLSYLFRLVKNFFQKFLRFFETFKSVCFCHSVQATHLLYHKFSRLSTVILNYLKSYLLFSISEAIPCDSLFTIPLPQGNVKHFLQIFSPFSCTKFQPSKQIELPDFPQIIFLISHNISNSILYLPHIYQPNALCIFN